MRRTARALSLAAVAGTVLGALAPAASAGTAPGSAGAWGTAPPSPCASPTGGHSRPGHPSWSAAPSPVKPGAHDVEEYEAETLVEEFTEADLYGATSLDASEGLTPEETGEADPLAPESAAEPPAAPDTAWEELIPDADAEERAGSQGAEGAPGAAGTAADPAAVDPYAADPYAADPYAADPGTMDHKAPARTAVDPEATDPGAAPLRTTPPKPTPSPTHKPTSSPKPTATHGTPCPSPTAHQGVQAGRGGAFTDSVPAQVAGGLLMAGAIGAAAHRVLRRRTGGTHA
ncbi:hypothetical protein [Streptomyces sp. NPDC006147]|uniref:hypothetical protein n=1 Tax=unclassified Streptomyces TaxID=2593676 RepID=UPI0033A9856B